MMAPLTFLVQFFGLGPGHANCGEGNTCDTGLPVVNASSHQLQTALQVIFGVAAALAVLMIVIAGFRFVTAQGNPQEVGKARATIIYAVVGLLVAVTAEGIVALALGHL
jgi:hypothetical protein